MTIPNPPEATRAWIYRTMTAVIVVVLVVALMLGFDINEIVAGAISIAALVTTGMAALNTSTKPPAPSPVDGGEII